MPSHRAPAVRAAIVVLACLALVSTAEARPRPRRAERFEANKTFGLGIMLGAPSGLSGKYFLGADTALDFGVGVYHNAYRYDDGLHVHADFLWHPVTLAKTEPFYLPLYFGVGGRLFEHDRGNNFDRHSHIGLRVPVGIAMDFNNVPLDIFLEFALVVDLLLEDNDDHVDLNSAIGIRYWF